MNYEKEYQSLFDNFVARRELELDNQYWSDADLEDFNSEVSALESVFAEYKASPEGIADAKYAEDQQYIIRATVDTLDGPIEEETDIRELSLEQLSALCDVAPQFLGYYIQRALES
jgi:hypothetical protein